MYGYIDENNEVNIFELSWKVAKTMLDDDYDNQHYERALYLIQGGKA